jgi:hypothetical protein
MGARLNFPKLKKMSLEKSLKMTKLIFEKLLAKIGFFEKNIFPLYGTPEFRGTPI